MKKFLKASDIVLNILLGIMYLFFIYLAATMLSFVPWYDENGMYLISMLALWLPLSIATIIKVVIDFVGKSYDKVLICLAALNAIYIPIIFVLGFIENIPAWPMPLTAMIGVATMITYLIKIINKYRKIGE